VRVRLVPLAYTKGSLDSGLEFSGRAANNDLMAVLYPDFGNRGRLIQTAKAHGLELDAERAQRVIDLSYRLFDGDYEGDVTKVDIEDYDMALSVWLGRDDVRGAGEQQAWERAHAHLPEEEQVQLLHEQAGKMLEEICADDDLGL
jgi:hypothetical protein